MKNFSSLASLTIFLLASLGCAPDRTAKSYFACNLRPNYPKLDSDEVSSARLISLFRDYASQDQVQVAELAAGDVEKDLAKMPTVDLESAFYRNQMKRLTKICNVGEDEYPSVAAAAFIEIQASALINAADLHNATDEVIRTVVPSKLRNLTAGANILVLAAVCSPQAHPHLAEELAKKGLPCGK